MKPKPSSTRKSEPKHKSEPDGRSKAKATGNYVDTFTKKIKELARQGVITPETNLENPEGRIAPARKAKGLVFGETQ